MNETQFICLQFIGHLLVDFHLQTDNTAQEKEDEGFKSAFLRKHILFVFLFSWGLSFQVNFVWAALAIAITHLIIDGVKGKIKKREGWVSRNWFFLDQLLHLFIIVVAVQVFLHYFDQRLVIPQVLTTQVAVILLGYLFCLKTSNIVIREMFNVFEIAMLKVSVDEDGQRRNNEEGHELKNAGKLIGVLERTLVLTFVLLSQFQAVGFLLAAKSILRFKEQEDIRTEYVLVGTMLSFAIAVGVGITINWLTGSVINTGLPF
ncbi:MAG TPA: DUF3307 domain-containing protein [Cytophagales bacterium]|nr:DUF3307 domain-containing protein [Cytophagales bacterium]HAA21604.1 DUF3307 domain-containing protein [Cytophagales bacterium]HAP62831.1 DUF3307 domain-containing protein [Cytophagales bacterium]